MATPSNINDPQWRFEQLGVPRAWLRQADLLKDSAEVLLRHGLSLWESSGKQAKPGDLIPDLAIDQSVLMYLYALAIENVVKGIVVAKNAGKLQSRRLVWSGDGHRLRELVTEADITFKNEYDEYIICVHFQSYLDWQGRYPIPKDGNRLMKSPLFHQNFLETREFDQIYVPLRDLLVAEILKADAT